MSEAAPAIGPDERFAWDSAAFFAARLEGPTAARHAVLATLSLLHPYPLAWIACTAGPTIGASRSESARLGLLAEALRGALRVSRDAWVGDSLPSRLSRAMRILVADTLVTFAFELAADLPAERGTAVRRLLGSTLGRDGFLGTMTDPVSHGVDPDRVASEFLAEALILLAPAVAPDPARRLRAAATLDLRHDVGSDGRALPAPLRDALQAWSDLAADRPRVAREEGAAARRS